MNEQTVQLLNGIAAKLGTTTEYLWGVLLKQAPIDAAIDLAIILFWVGLFYFTGKTAKKYEANITEPDGTWMREEERKKEKSGVSTLVVIAAYFGLCAVIYGVFSFQNIINGFFNPEYWALQQILSKM